VGRSDRGVSPESLPSEGVTLGFFSAARAPPLSSQSPDLRFSTAPGLGSSLQGGNDDEDDDDGIVSGSLCAKRRVCTVKACEGGME
jgi:hypothetical protein